MGTIKNTASGIGDALFTKTQRQVLGLLFGHAERSFFLNEIVRSAGVGIGSVQRELEKLASAGLLRVRKIGNQKHYQANQASPIFQELRGLVLKTFGVADELRRSLEPHAEKILVAFVYGSLAKGTDRVGSDVDVMIISDTLSYPELIGVFTGAEAQLGRTVNPTLYTASEVRRKLAEENSFLQRVTEQEKIFLIGCADDLPQP